MPNTGAGLVDLNAAICPDDTCTAVRDGVIIYRDSDHLTVRATQHLVEPLTRAIPALDSDRTHCLASLSGSNLQLFRIVQ